MPQDWSEDPKALLARAQAEYAAALRELSRVRAALQANGGDDPQLRRQLRAAEDRAAKAAARIAELRARD